MSLNCNEIDLIISELSLTGSFVQEIVQPNFESIAFYTYGAGGAKTILVSLAQNSTRLNETSKKITKNPKPLRFNECLKSKIKGCKITECRQISKERVILIKLHRDGKIYVMPNANDGNAVGEDENYNLYIRLWNNAANIILCDSDNKIIDTFFRRPKKNEITGAVFTPPEEKSFTDEEIAELEKKFPVRDTEALEVSPSLETPGASSASATRPSFNRFIDDWYSNFAEALSITSLREKCEKWYNEKKSRQEAALEKLKEKKADFLEAGRLKHQGDLILANMHLFNSGTSTGSVSGVVEALETPEAPRSANFFEVEDYETGNTVRIKIDPKKSAQENAKNYYELYKKETAAIESVEHDIELAEKRLAELEKTYSAMKNEENPVKLEQLLRKDSTPRQSQKKETVGLQYEINGWTVLVGRDSKENDELLRHNVKGFDTWLHVRDYQGGYVFIKKRAGKTVPLEILLYAGNLAVYFSKARKNRKADLYVTQVKYLRRAKNAPRGTVLPTNEKNLFIELDDAKMRELDEFRV